MTHPGATPTSLSAPPLSALPGASVIARIRRLLIVTGLVAVGYAAFTTSSRGTCVGAPATQQGEQVGSCIALTLGPSPLMLIAFVVVVIMALGRVLRHALTEADAIRILDRTALTVGIVAVASVVIANVWFQLIPIETYDPIGGYRFFFPFPFGSVDVVTTP